MPKIRPLSGLYLAAQAPKDIMGPHIWETWS